MNTLDSFTFLLCAQMLLNTYFTSRQSFVCQKKHFLYNCEDFLGGHTREQIFLVQKLA